jgi:dTMP kinase
MNGIFIALEGPDGSGKSTIAKKLEEYYISKGRDVEITREPGGTDIGEKIRELILDKNNTKMSYKAEALLYAAARAQLVEEKIIPWLKEDKIVISERYVYSSLVYQGLGRKLGLEDVRKINDFGTSLVKPNLVLLFDMNPEKALDRKLKISGGDRIEKENISFHRSVYEGYKKLINYFPEIKIINAERTVEEIFNDIKNLIDVI